MWRALASLGSLTVASGTVYFSETFDSGWQDRWLRSEFLHNPNLGRGTWALAPGRWFKDEARDAGLQTAQNGMYFTISSSFESFSNAGKELIVQYQAKYEQDIECGGGYIKVGPRMEKQHFFQTETPFNIMFGPDMCGYRKRQTDLVFTYKGKRVPKKRKLPYKQVDLGISHLYRLILRADNTARVEIDEMKVYEGSIKEDWEVSKPKEIFDPTDKKPIDWVDEVVVADPHDVKPDDWVEEKRIVNTAAKRPEDWDEEEDGVWEVPKKDNPAYKGEWRPLLIPNPAFKGHWKQRSTPNPEYVDEDVYKFDDFSYVGFDLWQVKGGTIFDNIILTDDKAEADKFAKMWRELNEFERSKQREEEEAAAKQASQNQEEQAAKNEGSGEEELRPGADEV